jgi:hypothetical protein
MTRDDAAEAEDITEFAATPEHELGLALTEAKHLQGAGQGKLWNLLEAGEF